MLGAGAWLAFAGANGVARSLGYQLGRGFEYGSLYSGVQMLAAKLVGAEIGIVRDHAAFSSITPWSARLGALVLPIQLALLLVVCATFVRRGMREGVRYSGAAVLAFVIGGKVFSPQYLIWLVPYIAALEGPIAARGRRLFAAGCLATLLAPAGLGIFSRTDLGIILAYNAKNLLFAWLLLVLLFGPAAEGEASPVPEP
jgi:hypothetical protein